MGCGDPDCSTIKGPDGEALLGAGVDVVAEYQAHVHEQVTAASGLPPTLSASASTAAQRCMDEIKAADKAVRRAGEHVAVDGPEVRAAEQALARARAKNLPHDEIKALKHRVESIQRKARAISNSMLAGIIEAHQSAAKTNDSAKMAPAPQGRHRQATPASPLSGAAARHDQFIAAKAAEADARRAIEQARNAREVGRALAKAKSAINLALTEITHPSKRQSLNARLKNLETAARTRHDNLRVEWTPGSGQPPDVGVIFTEAGERVVSFKTGRSRAGHEQYLIRDGDFGDHSLPEDTEEAKEEGRARAAEFNTDHRHDHYGHDRLDGTYFELPRGYVADFEQADVEPGQDIR